MTKRTLFLWICLFSVDQVGAKKVQENSVQKSFASHHKKQGIEYYVKKDFPKAESAFRDCIKYAMEEKNWKYQGQCLNNLGSVQFQMGQYAEGITSYEQATQIYQQNGLDTLLGQSYINLGLAYKKQNIYDSAINNFYKGIIILEDLKIKKSLMKGYNMLGNALRETNSLERSKSSYFKALKLALKNYDSLQIAGIYNNLGTLFRKQDKLDSAIHYYRLSLHIKKVTDQDKSLGNSHFNLGEVFLDLHSRDSALYHFTKSIEHRQLANDKFGLAHSKIGLIRLMIINGNIEMAKYHIDNTQNLISSIASQDLKLKFLKAKRDYSIATQKFSEAALISQKISTISENILNKEKQEIISSYEVKYDVRALQETIVSKNETLMWSFTALGFLVLAGIFLIRERQKKKRAADIIETLFKDMHHRVKNNLSLLNGVIRYRRRGLVDDNAKYALRDIGRQLDTVNLIHRKLYLQAGEKVGKIDLSQYLIELTEDIFVSSGIPNSDYYLKFDMMVCEVSADKANSVGLILNEAITNAIKYGKSQNDGKWTIHLELKIDENQIKICLTDTGVGIRPEITKSKTTGGLGLIELLSKQLSGSYEISGKKGTKLEMRFAK